MNKKGEAFSIRGAGDPVAQQQADRRRMGRLYRITTEKIDPAATESAADVFFM
jgi:hypothetical protein